MNGDRWLVKMVWLPDDTTILTWVASTPESRGRGLALIGHLNDNHGMLFVFERPGFHPMWLPPAMKIPLDIVWMDANGAIVDLAENLQPASTMPAPVYGGAVKSSYALELKAGSIARHGLRIGEHIVTGTSGAA